VIPSHLIELGQQALAAVATTLALRAAHPSSNAARFPAR
jgi:hypothetical protein